MCDSWCCFCKKMRMADIFRVRICAFTGRGSGEKKCIYKWGTGACVGSYVVKPVAGII